MQIRYTVPIENYENLRQINLPLNRFCNEEELWGRYTNRAYIFDKKFILYNKFTYRNAIASIINDQTKCLKHKIAIYRGWGLDINLLAGQCLLLTK